jgi:hypothetical protein
LEFSEDFGKNTEGDVVIDVMFDVYVFLCEDQVVDVFDFVDGGRRGCHITGAKWTVGVRV